jgi:hypothetical protein
MIMFECCNPGGFPEEGCSRREMLRRSALSFGSLAVAGLMHEEGLLRAADGTVARAKTQFPAHARSVVFIFLGGGPGHVDTFDPKPELEALAGRRVPDSIAKDVPRIARAPLVNLLPSPWKFRPHGESGIPVSDLFPHVAQCVDDLCVIRSCRHDSPIHAPAEYLTLTGSLLGERPSLGAWLTYGLGSENRNLPGFVVFRTGETVRPPGMASGFLPAKYQGVPVDVKSGIAHLGLPGGLTPWDRRHQLDFVHELNRRMNERYDGVSDLEARIEAYELGFRMQAAAPEAFDLSSETLETHQLYGIGCKETDEYARIFLQTRRLVEQGVRFIQVRSGGWDAHSDLLGNHTQKCGATDQPIAALLIDLKRRGLLDETLVIWGGEFGRTPAAQGGVDKPGRDHSPSGYSMWLAGGGVRGGQVIGATDPVGYAAVERPVHPHDLHATILRALGIDQHALFYERHNRRELVTVNGGNVIGEVFGEVPFA